MYIEEIKQISKYHCKVFLENGIHFRLSLKQVMKYALKAGEELAETTYEVLQKEVFLPAAKRKAMDLLLKGDQTEKELREKLKRKDFSEEVIDQAIAYVQSFHYLNDERYAENYVHYRSHGKSKRQILYELERKGICKERAEDLLLNAVDEASIVDQWIRKKMGSKIKLEYAEKTKLMAFLYRKGFHGELISDRIRAFLMELEKKRDDI